MRKFDPSLVVFRIVSFGVLVLGAFFAGFVIAKQQIFPYHLVNLIQHQVSVAVQEIPVMLGVRPIHFLQPARYPGAGVTVNALEGNENYVALASFFDGGTEIRLIRHDGAVVARWPAVLSELVPDLGYIEDQPATDWNVDLHGMVINPDGSVVFNFEYTALVKLDRCGELVWRVPRQTHHSVMRSEKGGYWVGGRRIVSGDKPSSFPPIRTPYAEDLLLRVSEDGEIEREISVLELFYNSGLAALLTAKGGPLATLFDKRDHEIVHLNDVEELPAALAADFPQLRAGDLLLSLQDYNMILAVDPVAKRIRWWRIGPWLRQHDPDFQPGGRITVFDNRSDDAGGRLLGGSAVVAHDMVSGSTVPVWGGVEGERMYTAIRGSHEMQSGGGVLAVETNAGRVIETDAAGEIVWEYINRYDEDEVVEITGAMVLPPDYFADVDWSCNPARKS